jgi:hypothetical protein
MQEPRRSAQLVGTEAREEILDRGAASWGGEVAADRLVPRLVDDQRSARRVEPGLSVARRSLRISMR